MTLTIVPLKRKLEKEDLVILLMSAQAKKLRQNPYGLEWTKKKKDDYNLKEKEKDVSHDKYERYDHGNSITDDKSNESDF